MKLILAICLGAIFAPSVEFGASDQELRVEFVGDHVSIIMKTNDAVWFNSSNGLFYWEIGSPEVKPSGADIHFIGFGSPITEEDGVTWIDAPGGLYWWQKGWPAVRDVDPNTDGVYGVSHAAGVTWLHSREGLFWWMKGWTTPRKLESTHDTNFHVFAVSDLVWITLGERLFWWKKPWRGPQLSLVDSGKVIRVVEAGGAVWISTDEKLYWWRKDWQAPLIASIATQGFTDITEAAGVTWISSENGLYWWEQGWATPRPSGCHATGWAKVHEVGGVAYISSKEGLFWWKRGWPAPRYAGGETGAIFDIFEAAGVLWISTEKGLFWWQKDWELPRRTSLTVDSSVKVEEAGGAAWITSFAGVHWWESGWREPQTITLPPDGERGISASVQTTGHFVWIQVDRALSVWDRGFAAPRKLRINDSQSYAIVESGGIAWIGTEKGLFSLNSASSDPQRVGLDTGMIADIVEAGNVLWIAAENGLFHIDGAGRSWTDAGIRITSALSDGLASGQPIPVQWRIDKYGQRTTPGLVRHSIHLLDGNGVEDSSRNQALLLSLPNSKGVFSWALDPVERGDYSLFVEAIDLWGQRAQSETVRFSVGKTTVDHIKNWLYLLGLGYVITCAGVFVVLVIGARWSERCFELLTDPVVRRAGLIFGFAIRRSRIIRTWVFERYYARLKEEFSTERDYLPGPMRKADGTSLMTSDLLDELKRVRQAWVEGPPGSGKTEMIQGMMRAYTRHDSLRAAARASHRIPIFISLRTSGGDDIVELASKVLGAKGIPLADAQYLGSLLRSGDFLLILDGMNEVNLDKAATEFAQSNPTVGMLLTSQTPPPVDAFPTYELPAVGGEFARQMLHLFVGEARAAEATLNAPRIWEEIQSGYDVRLMADLIIAGKAIPTTRLGLFRAPLDQAEAKRPDGRLSESIYVVAWDQWTLGKRRFSADERITEDELKRLEAARVTVPRGEQYEFRHDLMRGYLAACWASEFSPSLEVTVARLNTESIWNLSKWEQRIVFPMIAALLTEEAALQRILDFSVVSPGLRSELMVAILEEARRRGCTLEARPVK